MDKELYNDMVRLIAYLKAHNMTITTAESCTGGYIASSITNVEGSSKIFKYGFVTYHPESKNDLVGVSFETIEKYGLVSEQVAISMALGAQERARADIAISVTGNIGNTPNDNKEVCDVIWYALALKDKLFVKKLSYNDTQGEATGHNSRRINSKVRLTKEIIKMLCAELGV